jgi:hypothetical protein
VGFYDVNGSEILLIGKTKYGNATKIRGEITIPNNFHVAKTQNSGIPIPFFSLASGNVAKLKDIETKNALYANSLDIAQRVYSINERILSNNDVTIGKAIYFDIEAIGTLGYISLFDTENNVIAHYGKTSSTSEQYRYRGKFIIPNGFSHIEVDGNADVIVHSMSTIEINEQHYDSDYFVFFNQFSHRGNLDSFNGLCCTDYLYIKGATQLKVSNLPSSVYNVVDFFDESYQYISSVLGQIDNPINEVSVIPPINATYCRVNGNMDFMGRLSVIIVGASQEPNMGLRFNPIMSHDTINNVVPIFERGDINDLVLSRIPAAYKSGNLIYSVCEKRENNSDAGRIAIMLSCYNITNGDNVKKVILQSDDNIRYMNPIVYYDDYNILSAYAKRLYVFAIKVIGGADITELNSKDEADCIYIYSDDNGKTWSEEQSLKPYYPNDSIVFGTSPSSAIVVDNTLILPAFVVYGKGYALRSGIISFTKGESSFKMSQIVNDDNLINNECSVVPYGNRCCLFARNLIGDIGVYCTSDLSSDIHFLKYWSDRKFKTFTKAGCQIDVKRYKGVYFMTNIDIAGETDKSTGNRKNLSLYGSIDMKKWYPLVRIEKEKVFGYAVIIPSEQTLHVLYEDGDYQGISLCELTEWADKFIALKDEYINEQALYVIANR